MTLNASRRAFLWRACALAGTTAPGALPLALNLAAVGSAAAQARDYRAIVCLFLYGGNDAANMVLATDEASWARYTAARRQAPDPIALAAPGTPPQPGAAAASPAALGGVLPIEPARQVQAAENAARRFALHPAMPHAQGLFEQGRLAVLANVGPLIEPVIGRAAYQARGVRKPAKLFSHNDQQSTWQSGLPEGARVGWGGRLGDLMAAGNARAAFTSISASGNAVFLSGEQVFQYQVGSEGATAIGGIDGSLFGSAVAAQALREIVSGTDQVHPIAREYAAVTRRSIQAQTQFQAAFDATDLMVAAPDTHELPGTRAQAGNPLAAQLRTVARVIAARDGLGANRQVFFVSIGGFDTHGGQNVAHANLMARLSHALGYFDAQLGALGVRDQVTLFTASDFGRTFVSNGDGTDHGWGAHHFVMGAAVRGREIYGRFPELGDSDDAVGRSGSWIPVQAVDQVGATLGRWFGAGAGELDLVFPNLRHFGQRDLGFV